MIKIIIEKIFQIAILACAALLIDCSSSAYTVKEGEASELPKAASYAITVPEDYPQESDSGSSTSIEIRKVLANLGINATLLYRYPDYKSLPSDTRAKYDYIVEPVINYWEDNVTAWTGKPDKLLLDIIIYDAKTSAVMDKFTIDGKSARMIAGGNDPVELIKDPASVHYAKIIK